MKYKPNFLCVVTVKHESILFQAKIELCKYKDAGGWCCGRGSITIDWTVEKSGYVPGEDIIVNGAIQNESQESVAISKVALNMVKEVYNPVYGVV